MPLPERRWLPHATPEWVREDQEVFFITVCAAVRSTDLLVQPPVATELFEATKHRHKTGVWWTHLFLVMPDHVHGLFSFPRAGKGIKRAIADWKRWTATSAKIEWQKGFFDHRLRGHEGFDEKAHYIRMNPVRARFVARPEDWPHVWTPA